MGPNELEASGVAISSNHDASPRRWMRYQCALVAPFVDPATYREAVTEGWRLIESDGVARSALARVLASTFDRLLVFDDPWIGLRPSELGAILDPMLLALDHRVFEDVLGSDDDRFDPALELAPRPSLGALRIVGAVAGSLTVSTSHLTAHLTTPNGTPRRLFTLRRLVDRWMCPWQGSNLRRTV